jgi:hypothetical protein
VNEFELENMETFNVSIGQDANGGWWWEATGVRNGPFTSEDKALRDFENQNVRP